MRNLLRNTLIVLSAFSFNSLADTKEAAEITASKAVEAISSDATKTAAAQWTNDRVTKLFKSLENNMFPPSAYVKMSITSYKNDTVNKELLVEFFLKNGNVLIEILAPQVEKGKYILKTSKDLWMYFTRINRSIRLASRDSFMGTDANNYDLLELNLVDDYTIEGYEVVTVDGKPAIRAELVAKPDSEGYSRITSYIDPVNKRIIKNDCFAISGTLIKTISYSQHKQVGDYSVPALTHIQNHLEKGRHSTMYFESVEIDEEIDEFMFSLGYLESLN